MEDNKNNIDNQHGRCSECDLFFYGDEISFGMNGRLICNECLSKADTIILDKHKVQKKLSFMLI